MVIMIIIPSRSALRTATNVPHIWDSRNTPALTSLIVLSLFENCFIYNMPYISLNIRATAPASVSSEASA